MISPRRLGLIGVPIDFSAFGHAAGCSAGPTQLRAALAPGIRRYAIPVRDYGDVPIPPPRRVANPRLKHLPEVAAANRSLYERTRQCLQAGDVPVVLGGDHSGVIGSVKATLDHLAGDVSLLWIDSHPDCSTEATTVSGNLHGMVIPQLTAGGTSELMGIGERQLPFDQLGYFGVKDANPAEIDFIRTHRIVSADVWTIERHGTDVALRSVLGELLHSGRKLYVSFDLDVVDVSCAPGVGTPTRGGLSYREALYVTRVLRELFREGAVVGLDVVELNPSVDLDGRTAVLAAELLLSLVGYDYGPYQVFQDRREPL